MLEEYLRARIAAVRTSRSARTHRSLRTPRKAPVRMPNPPAWRAGGPARSPLVERGAETEVRVRPRPSLRPGCGRQPSRIEVLTKPVERLARVTRREALKAVVDAVARTYLQASSSYAREETIERPGRRSARPDAAEVVDAPVAGTDEVAGRLYEAHRTADVRAARGDRYVLVPAVARLGVDLGIAPADVDRGFTGLADVRHQCDHPRHVGHCVEVSHHADVLPARRLLLLESGAEREAEGGQPDSRRGDPTGGYRAAREETAAAARLALVRARLAEVGSELGALLVGSPLQVYDAV